MFSRLEVLHAKGELRVAETRGRDEIAVFERLGLQMIGKGLYTVFGQILTKTGDEEGVPLDFPRKRGYHVCTHMRTIAAIAH
jgi:hypothetical protein